MKTLFRLLCVGVCVLLLPAVVHACWIDYAVKIVGSDGTDALYSGRADIKAGVTYTFELVPLNSEQLLDGGDSIIEKLFLTINSDPEVGVEFGMRAGSTATTYNITSEVVVFDTLVNPRAYASAGITLTDRVSGQGAAPGATIIGLFDDGKTHQARYNGSSVFADLVDGFSIAGGTLTKEENKGTKDFPETILGAVWSIESEFWFTLSAKDSASGTSTFVVEIPEPATICLIGIAALVFVGKPK